MHWMDRVYGESAIDDPGLLALIGCPTFQRLKGIRQAGPSALASLLRDSASLTSSSKLRAPRRDSSSHSICFVPKASWF